MSQSPSNRSDEVEQGLDNQPRRIGGMINVSESIRKLKKKRRTRGDEKATDVNTDVINDAVSRGNQRGAGGG